VHLANKDKKMKKILFSLICFMMFACESDDEGLDVALIGNWKLIEIYSDPGGEGGRFAPVNSNKIITFGDDGSITSNGSLCDISTTSDNPTAGVYTLVDSTYATNDCGIPQINYKFEQTRNILVVTHFCIEDCRSKYIKQ
jgi:hypothetical protein